MSLHISLSLRDIIVSKRAGGMIGMKRDVASAYDLLHIAFWPLKGSTNAVAHTHKPIHKRQYLQMEYTHV